MANKAKQPFSNQSIIEPRPRKPHICKRQGKWRVSAMPKASGGDFAFDWSYRRAY